MARYNVYASKNELRITPLSDDIACFIELVQGSLTYVIGTHVDENIAIVDSKFEKKSRLMEHTLESKRRSCDSFVFAFNFERLTTSSLANQATYASKVQLLNLDCTFEKFRGCQHEITWLTHARPDLYAAVAVLSRITANKFERKYLKFTNNTKRRAINMKYRELWQHRPNRNPLRMITFSDSNSAKVYDMGTQLRFIILLMKDTGRANWLTNSSSECRGVMRSVLAGEICAFVYCFDAVYAIKHDIQVILHENIPLTILTVSESLFKTIVRSTVTTKKRLLIAIKVERELYDRNKIANID